MHLLDLVRRQSDGTSIGGALGDPSQAPTTGSSHIPNVDIICHAVALPIVSMIVLLRLWTKKFVIGSIHVEDFVCIAAYIFIVIYAILALFAGKNSAGVHAIEVPAQNYVPFAKSIYVLEITYGICALLVKLAVLLLLARIFGASSRFNLVAHYFSALLVLYYTIITFIKIFSCTPIRRLWYPTLPGTCLNNELIIYLDAIMAMVTDLIVILLPIPVVWKLNMKTSRKVTITATFAVGSLACVAAILRVHANAVLNKNADKFYYALPVVLWSFGELYIGLITGCLPVLPALFKHMVKGSNSRKPSPAASLYFRLGRKYERKPKPSALKSTNFSTTLVETRASGEEDIEMGEARGGEEQLHKEISRTSDKEPPKQPPTSPGPLKSPQKSPRKKWVDVMESVSRVPSRQEDPKYSVDSPRSPRDYDSSPMPPIAELRPTVHIPRPDPSAPTRHYQDLLAARARAHSNETLRKEAEAQKERHGSNASLVPKKREEWMGVGSTRGPRYKDVLEAARPRAPSSQSTREVSQLVQEAISRAEAPPMPAMPDDPRKEPRPQPVKKDSKYERKRRPAELKIPVWR